MHEGYSSEVHDEAHRFLASEIMKRKQQGEKNIIPAEKPKAKYSAEEASKAAKEFYDELVADRTKREEERLPVTDDMIIDGPPPAPNEEKP